MSRGLQPQNVDVVKLYIHREPQSKGESQFCGLKRYVSDGGCQQEALRSVGVAAKKKLWVNKEVFKTSV